MCLDVTKLVLRKINSGVWFIQIFLQKMHQIRQKKPKPSKRKWINDERRAVRWATSDERCDRWSTRGAIVDQRARLSDAHRSSIMPLVDRWAMRSSGRLHCAISSIALVGAVRSSDERRDRRSVLSDLGSLFSHSFSDLGFLFSLSLSLSLSLSFRKSLEVKMRGETDFRVKGEKIGQPEVIFRKMIFSVTAKHAEKGENDFLKSFSPKTNAP